MKLLIVEDDTLQSIDLEETLLEMGHEVIAVAQHVQAAIQRLAEVADEVDLVLLDMSLAGQSAGEIAVDLDRRGIPYVAVTGLSRRDLSAMGMNCPVVRKPFAPAALRKVLEGLPQA